MRIQGRMRNRALSMILGRFFSRSVGVQREAVARGQFACRGGVKWTLKNWTSKSSSISVFLV